MTALVFVDANVFLYARDETEPEKLAKARSWLEHLWHNRLGRTSLQVLSEYYVNLRRIASSNSRADLWKDVAKYLAWQPQAINEELFNCAREVELRYRLSWWDSMVVAATQLTQCSVLLTEDLQDKADYGGVTVRSPFTLAVEEPRSAYAAASGGLPLRHRRRGRPRTTALA
jgi:predicted nucleic acid-binding protein